MSIKRTTHTWLKPVWDNLDGLNQKPFGVATSIHGFYGQTGVARIATGSAGIISGTYIGASGLGATLVTASGNALGASGLAIFLARYADNGGSGTPYTFGDMVTQLKNMGALKP